jgi:hypothetical protein
LKGGEKLKLKKKKPRLLITFFLLMVVMMMSSIAAFAATTPTGLTATPSDSQVTLSWTATVDGQYNVYQSVDGTTFTKITSTAITTTSYAVGGLTDGTTYYFKVTSYDGTSESTQTTSVSATPAAATGIFTNLTSSSITSEATTWASNFDNVLLVVVGIGMAFAVTRFVKGLFF